MPALPTHLQNTWMVSLKENFCTGSHALEKGSSTSSSRSSCGLPLAAIPAPQAGGN